MTELFAAQFDGWVIWERRPEKENGEIYALPNQLRKTKPIADVLYWDGMG